ncbi:hypothetical protein FXO37_29137 [Capsicum annuum]|nr:hypothetical protein FXO37_29137 [Capsicum annuum]
MPPKNVSPSKQAAKKNTKQVPAASAKLSDSEYETSSTINSEVYKRTITKKDAQKEKVAEKSKEKKVVPQESDSPPKNPRRKNPTTSPPHVPQPADDNDDEVESSSPEASSEEAQGLKDVDATLIDIQAPSFALNTAPVPIVE